MKSHLHFILFLNIKKKLGVTSHSEELGPIEGSHVFDYICTQKRIDARADFQLWRTRTTLFLHGNDSKLQDVIYVVSETWNQ